MDTNDKATAAFRAAMAKTDALSWQAAHRNFKSERFDAQLLPLVGRTAG